MIPNYDSLHQDPNRLRKANAIVDTFVVGKIGNPYMNQIPPNRLMSHKLTPPHVSSEFRLSLFADFTLHGEI